MGGRKEGRKPNTPGEEREETGEHINFMMTYPELPIRRMETVVTGVHQVLAVVLIIIGPGQKRVRTRRRGRIIREECGQEQPVIP